jgi:hypothetical protein
MMKLKIDNGKLIMFGLVLTFSIFNSQLSIAWAECLLLPIIGDGSDKSPFQPSFPPGMSKIPGFKWNAHIPSKPDGTPQYPDTHVCFPEGFKFPPGLAALPPAQAAADIKKRDPKADVLHMAKIPPTVIKGSWQDYRDRAYRLAKKYLGAALAWAASATDAFTGTGTLGANWSTGYGSESAPTRVSDVAECALGVRCLASYSAMVPGADQYAQGVVVQYAEGLDGDAGVGVRMAAPSTFTGYFARAGYFAEITPGGGEGSTKLEKRVGGSSTVLASDPTYPLWVQTPGVTPGTDVVRLEAVGTALTLLRNGTPLLTPTDSTSPLTSGRGGIFINSLNAVDDLNVGRLDNFEVGDLGVVTPSAAVRRRVVIVQ